MRAALPLGSDSGLCSHRRVLTWVSLSSAELLIRRGGGVLTDQESLGTGLILTRSRLPQVEEANRRGQVRWCQSLWGLPQLQNTHRKQHSAWYEPRVPQELRVLPGSRCSLPHPHRGPRGSAHPKPMAEGAISQASWAGGPAAAWAVMAAPLGSPRASAVSREISP